LQDVRDVVVGWLGVVGELVSEDYEVVVVCEAGIVLLVEVFGCEDYLWLD